MTVYVLDIGITAPSFPASLINIVVSEGALAGASVYQTEATDPDGDALTYRLTPLDTFQQFTQDFTITNGYDFKFIQIPCIDFKLLDFCLKLYMWKLVDFPFTSKRSMLCCKTHLTEFC